MSHTDSSGCPPHELHSQVEFAKNPPEARDPTTEFRRTPDRTFLRDFFSRRLRFPDGLEMEMWSFEDERSGRGFPAPPIRAREGEIVHVTVKPSKGPHTIHLHGIEPDPRNDGVGHSSFEVSGRYTYQFRPNLGKAGDPNKGKAGTYFYHCHVNTVLHVQMGMFGPMIFDPPSGRGKDFIDDPVGYDTRAETMIASWGADPTWHRHNHAAGLDGKDMGFNKFRPTNFYLLGGDLNAPWPKKDVKTVTRVPATVPPDKPGLLRILNGSYHPTTLRLRGGLRADVISHDGYPLRDTSQTPSPPTFVNTDVLGFGPAERYDLRLRPPSGARPGDTFSILVEWRDWVTKKVIGTVEVPVVVLNPAS